MRELLVAVGYVSYNKVDISPTHFIIINVHFEAIPVQIESVSDTPQVIVNPRQQSMEIIGFPEQTEPRTEVGFDPRADLHLLAELLATVALLDSNINSVRVVAEASGMSPTRVANSMRAMSALLTDVFIWLPGEDWRPGEIQVPTFFRVAEALPEEDDGVIRSRNIVTAIRLQEERRRQADIRRLNELQIELQLKTESVRYDQATLEATNQEKGDLHTFTYVSAIINERICVIPLMTTAERLYARLLMLHASQASTDTVSRPVGTVSAQLVWESMCITERVEFGDAYRVEAPVALSRMLDIIVTSSLPSPDRDAAFKRRRNEKPRIRTITDIRFLQETGRPEGIPIRVTPFDRQLLAATVHHQPVIDTRAVGELRRQIKTLEAKIGDADLSDPKTISTETRELQLPLADDEIPLVVSVLTSSRVAYTPENAIAMLYLGMDGRYLESLERIGRQVDANFGSDEVRRRLRATALLTLGWSGYIVAVTDLRLGEYSHKNRDQKHRSQDRRRDKRPLNTNDLIAKRKIR